MAMSSAGRIRLSLSLVCIAAITATSPASAQGLLQLFLGAPQAPAAATSVSAPVRTASMATVSPAYSAAPRPTAAYCVRLCDGFFFPIQPAKTGTSAQLCNALCPGSSTKIFYGSEIKHSVGADGTRYAALTNAFAYRKQMAPGCTCNGKDHYGLAAVAIGADPTLRAGDMVATRQGALAPVR
jgi:uncharacterized protein DUF2865